MAPPASTAELQQPTDEPSQGTPQRHLTILSDEERDALERQLEEANRAAEELKASAAERAVKELNGRYAFIHAVGSKTAVLDLEAPDASSALLPKETLFERTANRFVPVQDGTDKKGNPVYKDKSTGRVWYYSPERREYSRIIFAPGEKDAGDAFNLWSGWAVDPGEAGGTFRMLRAHILHNICNGSQEHYDFVLDWIADIFQNPQRKPGVALALLGGQGVGKSVLGEIIGFLLGKHYVATSDAEYVLGQFNAACENKLLLQMEEAVWAGDVKRQGKLKDTITAQRIMIRQLYVAPYPADNHMRFLFTSNEAWAVPVEPGDRRFAVFTVESKRKEDKVFFGRLKKELSRSDNSGYKALLRHLLERQIPKDRFHKTPRTLARTQQMLKGLKQDQEWWYNVLLEGALPGANNEEGWVNAEHVYDSFIRHTRNVGYSRANAPNIVRDFLVSVVPGLEKGKKFVPHGGTRKRKSAYLFPPLKECRRAFAETLGAELIWDDPDADWDDGAEDYFPEF